ncbi:MAG: histidine kinase [Bacteroidales bacterium]|jgi:signal transduction histidine kinase|nr:histidine kinase [Bacteroidales bacterium]
MSLFNHHKEKDTDDNMMLRMLLSEFNRSLMLIVDKDLLIANTIAKVKEIAPVDQVIFYLQQQDTEQYHRIENSQYTGEVYKHVIFNMQDRLINWLSVNDTFLLVSQSPDLMNYFSEKEKNMILESGIEFIYPLKIMNRMSGIVFLGKRIDGQPFSDRDLDILTLLFDQAAFAIENTVLYEEQSSRVKKMYRADRLAILGQLAAGAAHEIRNPLTAIRSTIQYLGKGMDDPDKVEMVDELMEEVDRINKIVQGLLSFSKPSELEMAEVDIRELLQQSLTLLNSQITKGKVQVHLNIQAKNTKVEADASQLKQVFLNIMLNAIEAISGDEEKHLTLSVESSKPVDMKFRNLIISFTDNGKGILPEDIENIFNPFYTTKVDGTGLGLPISYGIINRHGGELEVNSTFGEGTTITVKLPQLMI